MSSPNAQLDSVPCYLSMPQLGAVLSGEPHAMSNVQRIYQFPSKLQMASNSVLISAYSKEGFCPPHRKLFPSPIPRSLLFRHPAVHPRGCSVGRAAQAIYGGRERQFGTKRINLHCNGTCLRQCQMTKVFNRLVGPTFTTNKTMNIPKHQEKNAFTHSNLENHAPFTTCYIPKDP